PDTHVRFSTAKGTVPRKSSYECAAPTCGRVQDVLDTVKASKKTGPVAAYAIQGYCPTCDVEEKPYGGRFFAPAVDTRPFDAAHREWAQRCCLGATSEKRLLLGGDVRERGFMSHNAARRPQPSRREPAAPFRLG